MLWSNPAAATARTGGVIYLVGDSGNCNVSASVPLNTVQDVFALSRSTGCAGTASSVDLRADAATGSIGLRGTSAGNGLGSSQAAAQVSFMDLWSIGVPVGFAPGTFSIPATLKLDGSVPPGALSGFNRLADYSLTFRDLYGGLSPTSLLQGNGSITTAGSYALSFSGNIEFRYYGPGSALPPTAEVTMSVFMPGLNEGTVDFYNTASVWLDLPPGFTATTSSGIPLMFTPAVPEPSSGALMLLGAACLGAGGAWRRARSARLRSDSPVLT
ncbi:MAG: PEP-CTERM sorting domain-containing protein [Burkholderiaceae bacterium]